MSTVPLPPLGATFGRLAVIGEARTSNGRQAMLCLCECGQQKIAQVSKLLSGHTKSCGCLRRSVIDLTRLNPGEIPLYGKKAAGRVARVDEADYDLVMQHRWHVTERAGTATRRQVGPYAIANAPVINGHGGTLLMHCLIMGIKGIDHIDHDTLNNRRSNLRPATKTQNAGNRRPRLAVSSAYKGVSWFSPARRWQAEIQKDKQRRHLGYFLSELDAAYAYDAAARELFGEFAYPNFPGAPTDAMRQQWRADKDAAVADRNRAWTATLVAAMAQRVPETRVCTICGSEYQTRAFGQTFYCGDRCKQKEMRRRRKERQLEGRLF